MKNKIALITIIIITLSSCTLTKENIFAPNKRVFKAMPQDAHPDFKMGWMHGCETGLATGFTNDFYKMFYGFNKNVEMVRSENAQYSRGWYTAMRYCRHFGVGTLKEAGMAPSLPGKGYRSVLPLLGENGGHSIFGSVLHPKSFGAMGLSNW
jgi:hypothetical protein